MSGNKPITIAIFWLCINVLAFGLERHQTIQVPPIGLDSVISYRHEFDAISGQSSIVFSGNQNEQSNDIISVIYAGSSFVEKTNSGRVFFFLRYPKDNSDERELWRYDTLHGLIEYITNVTGIYAVSEDGTIVGYRIFRGYTVPNTDVEFYDLQKNSVLKILNGEKEISKLYDQLDANEYFDAYVEFDKKTQAFLITLDDWNEGGPKTFSLYMTISELRGR